jgi:hypothetical protein
MPNLNFDHISGLNFHDFMSSYKLQSFTVILTSFGSMECNVMLCYADIHRLPCPLKFTLMVEGLGYNGHDWTEREREREIKFTT